MSTYYSNRYTGERLYTGVEAFPRQDANSSAISITNQSMRLTYFVGYKHFVATSFEVPTGSTAAGATPTLCRVGLYTIDSAGAGTLVASCANTTTLWANTTTNYTPALSSSYTVIPGQLYAMAFLIVTGATAPQLHGRSDPTLSTAGPASVIGGSRGRFGAVLTSQSDLPATFADASLTTTGTRAWGGLV